MNSSPSICETNECCIAVRFLQLSPQRSPEPNKSSVWRVLTLFYLFCCCCFVLYFHRPVHPCWWNQSGPAPLLWLQLRGDKSTRVSCAHSKYPTWWIASFPLRLTKWKEGLIQLKPGGKKKPLKWLYHWEENCRYSSVRYFDVPNIFNGSAKIWR